MKQFMSCNKLKTAYFSKDKIYTTEDLSTEIPDATSDYDNTAENSLGKGLVTNTDNGAFFFQTDLNTQTKAIAQTLINAFTLTTPPTSAYEIALDTNLKTAKASLEEILKIIP